jgi:hypothetical protein
MQSPQIECLKNPMGRLRPASPVLVPRAPATGVVTRFCPGEYDARSAHGVVPRKVVTRGAWE